MSVSVTPTRLGLGAGEAFASALPRVHAVTRYHTRRVTCPVTREDLVAEAVALAWKYFAALTRRGHDPGAFVTAMARRAAQAALAGHRVCGAERADDALSRLALLRGLVVVRRLRERTHQRWDQVPAEMVAEEL